MIGEIIADWMKNRQWASMVEIREVEKLQHTDENHNPVPCLEGTVAILYEVPSTDTSETTVLRVEVLKHGTSVKKPKRKH